MLRSRSLCASSARLRRAVAASLRPRPTVTAALLSLCRGVRYRSLASDDPFGERGTWDDPSDGIYAAWQDVDQEGFVSAAESAEVRQAHFGPEWSRFTTVGRLSVRKMREDPRHQTREEGQPTAYPSADEAHARELRERQRVMARNYATYEEYLAAELGGGGSEDLSTPPDRTVNGADHPPAYATEAEMELAFAAVDGLDGRDRMALRNPAREALMEAEAAEAESGAETELPDFMKAEVPQPTPEPLGSPQRTASSVPGHAAELDVAAAAVSSSRGSETNSPTDAAPSGRSSTVPEAFAASVLAQLPGRHGDPAIPLTDPTAWHTSHIVRFLECFERASGAGAGAAESSSLDESMREAFYLARVDGELLLNVVTPPRLFRVLRRWHMRRQEVVMDAWQRVSAARARGEHTGEAEKAIIAAAAERAGPKLDEAVAPVTPLLIQETILMCFPYAR